MKKPGLKKNRYEPLDVRQLTRSPLMVLAALLMTVSAGLSLWREAQRVLWLTRDFKPHSFPLLNPSVEDAFMAVQEGSYLLLTLLAVLTAAGCVTLAVSKRPKASGFLRVMMTLQAWLCRLAGLACVAATVFVTWFCVHYRMAIGVVGAAGIIGTACLIACLIGARFFTNVRRTLKDVGRSAVRGHFLHGEAVRCRLRFQGFAMALIMLTPTAMVLLEGVVITAVADALATVFGSFITDWLRSVLGGGVTGVGSMYLTETLCSITAAGACALTSLLYGTYRHAHGLNDPFLKKRKPDDTKSETGSSAQPEKTPGKLPEPSPPPEQPQKAPEKSPEPSDRPEQPQKAPEKLPEASAGAKAADTAAPNAAERPVVPAARVAVIRTPAPARPPQVRGIPKSVPIPGAVGQKDEPLKDPGRKPWGKGV